MTRSESPLLQYILSLLLTLIILGLSFQNKINWLVAPANKVFIPLRYPFTLTRNSLDKNIQFLKNLPHQQRLIDDLTRRNAQLSLNAQKTAGLQIENDSLKSLLAAKVSPNHRVISVKVIGLSRFATLNQGANVSITPNLPVVDNDILVGITTSVSPNTTSVRLLSDPDTTIEVITLSGTMGKLIFQNNTLTLSQVPQKDLLNQDEPLFTKGDLTIPDGLLIGHIQTISNNESSLYQSATVTPAVTITQSQRLFVLLD